MNQAIEIDLSRSQGVTLVTRIAEYQAELAYTQRTLASVPCLTATDVMDLRDNRTHLNAVLRTLYACEQFGDLFGTYSLANISKIIEELSDPHGQSCYCAACM